MNSVTLYINYNLDTKKLANSYPFDCSRHDHATEWPPITLDDSNDTTGRYGSLLGTTAGVVGILQNEIFLIKNQNQGMILEASFSFSLIVL